jgi:hypothetical protein
MYAVGFDILDAWATPIVECEKRLVYVQRTSGKKDY